MKIALFSDGYKICGVSNLVYQVSEYCKKNKIQLTIFIPFSESSEKIAELKSDGPVKVIRLEPKYSLEVYPDLYLDFTPETIIFG